MEGFYVGCRCGYTHIYFLIGMPISEWEARFSKQACISDSLLSQEGKKFKHFPSILQAFVHAIQVLEDLNPYDLLFDVWYKFPIQSAPAEPEVPCGGCGEWLRFLGYLGWDISDHQRHTLSIRPTSTTWKLQSPYEKVTPAGIFSTILQPTFNTNRHQRTRWSNKRLVLICDYNLICRELQTLRRSQWLIMLWHGFNMDATWVQLSTSKVWPK